MPPLLGQLGHSQLGIGPSSRGSALGRGPTPRRRRALGRSETGCKKSGHGAEKMKAAIRWKAVIRSRGTQSARAGGQAHSGRRPVTAPGHSWKARIFTVRSLAQKRVLRALATLRASQGGSGNPSVGNKPPRASANPPASGGSPQPSCLVPHPWLRRALIVKIDPRLALLQILELL